METKQVYYSKQLNRYVSEPTADDATGITLYWSRSLGKYVTIPQQGG